MSDADVSKPQPQVFEWPPAVPRVGEIVQIQGDGEVGVYEGSVTDRWTNLSNSIFFIRVGQFTLILTEVQGQWRKLTYNMAQKEVLLFPIESTH